MTDPIQIAQERFEQGFSCSQSVFSAYAHDTGLPEETALKLASAFGGGVAHQGNVCGAVSGALMVLGLQKGSATLENKDNNYQIAEEFIRRFKEHNGTIVCRELINYDISKPEELQNARDQGVFKTTCPGLVKSAAALVSEFLEK